jgi:archaellum biogenesis ATPase FlaH
LTQEVLALKRHALGLKLSSALAAGRSGSEVEELIVSWQSMVGIGDVEGKEEVQVIEGISVEKLFATAFNKDNLVKIYPKSLNDRLDGGVLPGTHILVFANTEMGKTLVAINMVAGFLHQKLPTLYVGNEDPAENILLRLGTRLSGLNKYEIRDNPKRAQELIDSRSAGLFTIAPLAPGTFPEIQALVRKYLPKVVILDQLRNLDVKSENRTQALERAATEARNLAKRFGLVVVSITQAGDSASGKAALGTGDVDSSNVGIPGQMDVMIGVGATEEMLKNNTRMLSFPKNKVSGNHNPITVTVDPQLSKVIDQ